LSDCCCEQAAASMASPLVFWAKGRSFHILFPFRTFKQVLALQVMQ